MCRHESLFLKPVLDSFFLLSMALMLSYLHVSFFKIKNHESTGVMHAGGMLYSKSIVTSRLSWDVMSLHVSNHLDLSQIGS